MAEEITIDEPDEKVHGEVLAKGVITFGFDGFVPGNTVFQSEEPDGGHQPALIVGDHLACVMCGSLMQPSGMISETLVGVMRMPVGHDHDDNCLCQRYDCPNGHSIIMSKRRRCTDPECNWIGKAQCFCHPYLKLDEWPL